MAALIKERISALPANKQPGLLKWLGMMDSAPTQVSELVDVLCAGEPMFPGPGRNLLLEIAGADELKILATRLEGITDSSTRESIYRIIDAGVHRIRHSMAANLYTHVAKELCIDIAEFDSGRRTEKLTIVAGVFAMVTCFINARGVVTPPDNQCPLPDELKEEMMEVIRNRELWVETGRYDPWQFWGTIGALVGSTDINWLSKPRN